MLNYEKRKNNKLFESMHTNKKLQLSRIQNFIPIYSNFFSLNSSNYNNINLNHEWYVTRILNKHHLNDNTFFCEIVNRIDKEFKIDKKTYIKMAPLLEPYKYLFGKYSNYDSSTLFNLPSFDNTNVHEKIADRNNSSYVDSFFCYLSSQLLNKHKIINCLDFYGSFLAVKKKYKIDIIDDIDYLSESDYFVKNQNKLFHVEDYSHLIHKPKLKPIVIVDDAIDLNLNLEDINVLDNKGENGNKNENLEKNNNSLSENIDINISELTESNINLNNKNNSIKSICSSILSSSCSSRTSHSKSGDYEENYIDNNSENLERSEVSEELEVSDCSSDLEEEMLFATFEEFPIQMIFLECCDGTLDSLIMNDEDLSHDEIFSALMQIIMTLLVYQKVFSFTHNDLHTNNVMYVKTNVKYVYYKYENKIYKVPTFGKIYKIIDFGRAIYKINRLLICSDSFKNGNDAATQYNIEPYFNESKPRLEPNFSFDLCRLACSMFDYFIDDMSDIENLDECDPLVRLIVEWCLDDSGINILYKHTGVERYADFKLYKMISRLVHNHTPEAQLNRDVFKKYLIPNKSLKKQENMFVMDLDNLPSYTENIQ